ncbi:SCO1860 family LAETG-anchored protein [Streptomyces asoensis]|uniref:SCO1860 family LAETG-anchored protein n=1 Tax=Streptomyces asoensis TaxID=249586 RepID=UPI0033E300DF
MNGNNFPLPARARRAATVCAVTALAAGPALLAGADTAHATSGQGRAGASVLRTGLDVALLGEAADVPLAVSLNEVEAPRSAEKTALTARLHGVHGGRPFDVLRADVAEAKATVEDGRAEASVRLVRARLHVPGLPLLSLVEVGTVTSRATCEAGRTPVAVSDLPGAVTVLGKRVSVSTGGPTDVRVPGVGEVRLDLSKRATTSRTAAATALELTVSVDPSKLGVARVTGTMTLAKATCETPPAADGEAQAPPSPQKPEPEQEQEQEQERPAGAGASPSGDVRAQGAPARADLAQTGGGSLTPYIAGGAIALLAVGAGTVTLARRRP